jgi:hypothetical protein
MHQTFVEDIRLEQIVIEDVFINNNICLVSLYSWKVFVSQLSAIRISKSVYALCKEISSTVRIHKSMMVKYIRFQTLGIYERRVKILVQIAADNACLRNY